jgi:hypothetical protein
MRQKDTGLNERVRRQKDTVLNERFLRQAEENYGQNSSETASIDKQSSVDQQHQ